MPSKWLFFYSNDFFKSTPFSGFSFVQEAKSRKEAIFWWTLIGLFAVITIINVHDTWSLYLSQPTRMAVTMSSSKEDIYLTNLTLKLQLSLAEFIEVPPLKLTSEYVKQEYIRHDYSLENYLDTSIGMLNFACLMSIPTVPENYIIKTMLYEQIMGMIGLYWDYSIDHYMYYSVHDWLELFDSSGLSWLDPEAYPNKPAYQMGDENIWEEWVEQGKDYTKKVGDFMREYSNKKPTQSIEYQFLEHLTNAFGPHLSKKHAILMTLESMKLGQDPRIKLFEQLAIHFNSEKQTKSSRQEVEYSAERDKLYNHLLSGDLYSAWAVGPESLLKALNATASQVLDWATIVMNELTHFQISNATAQIYLTDFSYDLTETSLPAVFTLKLIVPEQTRAIDVSIYSRLVQRFENLYRTITNVLPTVIVSLLKKQKFNSYTCNSVLNDPGMQFEEFKTKSKFILCNMFGIERPVLEQLYEYMLLPFFSQYKTAMMASLAIESESLYFAMHKPFHHYQLQLKTSRQFKTATDDCYAGTYEECLNTCILGYYEKYCNCFLWYLKYMNPGAGSVCAGPCAAADAEKTNCSVPCESLMRHPCKLENYEIDQVQVTPDNLAYDPMDPVFGPTHPVFSFSLDVGDQNFGVFTEEYAMPRNVFLSDLGGHLDLWLGINVIGVIHLLVYITKQIIYASNTKTKTGARIRSMFQRTTEKDIGEDDPNDTNNGKTTNEPKTQMRKESSLKIEESLDELKIKRVPQFLEQINRIMKLDAQNSELKQQLLKQSNVSPSASESDDNLKESNDKTMFTRWSIWRRNDFFTSTPFAGFSFVQEAKTVIEAIFWYICILTFTVIMINNVCETWQRYLDLPTHTTATLASTNDDVYLTNFTLKLKLSLTELIQTDPTKYSNIVQLMFQGTDEADEVQSDMHHLYKQPMPIYYACLSVDPLLSQDYLRRTMLYYQILSTVLLLDGQQQANWLDLFLNWWKQEGSTSNLEKYKLGENGIIEEWRKQADIDYNRIKQFMQENDKPGSSDIFDYHRLLEDMMKPASANRHAVIMTLEALKSGRDPRTKLFNQLRPFLSNTQIEKELKNLIVISEQQKQLVKQITDGVMLSKWNLTTQELLTSLQLKSSDLVDLAAGAVNDVMHIESPGMEPFLIDWNYEINNIMPMEFIFKLKIPQEIKHGTVKIYSRLVQRFQMIYWGLVDQIVENAKKATGKDEVDEWDIRGYYGECTNMNQQKYYQLLKTHGATLDVLELMHDYMFIPFYSQYETSTHSSLTIDTGRGLKLIMKKPFNKYNLRIRTIAHLESNVENCQVGTSEQCIEECLLDLHEQLCNCCPFELIPAKKEPQSEICTQPCTEADDLKEEKCKPKCELLMQHPCKLTNYEIDEISVVPYDLDRLKNLMYTGLGRQHSDHPVFSFALDVGDIHYAVFSEQYSIPRSVFLSNLGGQLDLWMGINVIGVIHLVLFIFLALHSRLRSTKTSPKLSDSEINKMDQQEMKNEFKKLENVVLENIGKLKKLVEQKKTNIH